MRRRPAKPGVRVCTPAKGKSVQRTHGVQIKTRRASPWGEFGRALLLTVAPPATVAAVREFVRLVLAPASPAPPLIRLTLPPMRLPVSLRRPDPRAVLDAMWEVGAKIRRSASGG